MAQHAVFWLAATSLFLFDDRADTSIRTPLSFALGLSCLAVFLAARAVSADGQRRKARRLVYLAVATIVLGLLSLHGAYLRSVGGLHAQAIEAILQTDFAEAFGYVATQLLFLWAMLWLISVALLWITLPYAPDGITGRRRNQALLFAAGLTLIVLGRGVITAPLEVVKSYRDGTNALRESVRRWQAHPHDPIASTFHGTVILVIGESTSRHPMAVYGYPRDTTPQLAALRPELAIFEDVISNYSSTVESLVDALTLRPRGASSSADSDRVGVPQLANAAGFDTVWLSNQNEFGVWDNPARILAQQADRVRFHDPSLGQLNSRKLFDEVMLPSPLRTF